MSEVTQWLTGTTLGRLVLSVTAVMVVAVAIRFAQGVINRSVEGRAARHRGRKIATFVGSLVAAMVVLLVFSDSLEKVGVALGVAGAGFAFALQEVIVSVAGWIAVSVGSFYRVGDRVQLGGIKGDVIDIGVLRTTIMEIGEWVYVLSEMGHFGCCS